MSRNRSLTEFVSERPRVLSALWTAALAGSTVAKVVVSSGGATTGP
ncbi:DUF7503 family protein [Halorussus ruber]|nr:hypothetical protein [Halorussus ruber]